MRLTTKLLLFRASWRLVKDPNRLDEVFELADRILLEDRENLDVMLEHLRAADATAHAIRQRRLTGVPSLPSLRALPRGTFGHAVAAFLDARGLDPKNLPQRSADSDAQFLLAHLYETHDVWHVATGFDTDVAGELGLQAFYAAQIQGKLPYLLLAVGLLNTLLFAFGDRTRRISAIVHGWELGVRARPFFGVNWAELWDRPESEVRRQLGVSDRRETQLAQAWAQAPAQSA